MKMVMGSLTVNTDVLVIGGGPGGYVAAIRAAQLGKEVTLVDREKKLGGVCLNTGCIPTKALIHASDYVHELGHLDDMGITIKGFDIDIRKMKAWKDAIVDKLEQGIQRLFKRYDIDVIEGEATFKSENSVMISGKSDINEIIFKSCIIATGSSPIELPNFKFNGTNIISSTEALDLEELPKKTLIIGGGYIGTELGTVLGKLGSDVSIMEDHDRLISSMDAELVEPVARKLESFNIKIYYYSKALSWEKRGDITVVKAEQQGKEIMFEADKVIIVIGRKPNSQGLGLEKANVKINEKGFIIVDSQMRTSSQNIYAIGDVAGQPMLAHKASREGKVAAEVICGKPSAFDNKAIPFVVFNDPEIASVGLTEEQAKLKGYDIMTGRFPFNALGRALTLNHTDGFVKFVAHKDTGIILGVHAVGYGVSDIISEGSLAIEMAATLEDIAGTIHPHPTLPESLMEAAEAALGKSIHIFMHSD